MIRRDAVVRFATFRLDLLTGEIDDAGTPVPLQPQPLRVLRELLGRPGELVKREELQRALWGEHTHVDFDQGLNFCVRQIRRALRDSARAPRYVETLPRRGYRFVAPVEQDPPGILGAGSEPAAAPAPKAAPSRSRRTWALMTLSVAAATLGLGLLFTAARPAERRMLVVLPFENLSPETGQDRLAEGLTEELTAELGRIQPQRLGVTSRTAAAQYAAKRVGVDAIARELKVDYVVEGSVRKSGDRVRITVSLIKADDRAQLFSESYESASRDLFALQSDVARQIARRVQQSLAPDATAIAHRGARLTGSLFPAALEARERRPARTRA